MKELDSYRKKQHAQIRRASIHEFLTRNRQMFEPLDKSGKVSILLVSILKSSLSSKIWRGSSLTSQKGKDCTSVCLVCINQCDTTRWSAT